MNELQLHGQHQLTRAVVAMSQREGVSANYQKAVSQFVEFLDGRPTGEETVREFKELLEARNLKAATVTLKVKAVKSMIRKALVLEGSLSQVDRYRLEQTLNDIKCAKPEVTAETISQKSLNHGQVHALLENCKDTKALTVMKVILSTAGRISEVLQLTHEGLSAPDSDSMRHQDGILLKGGKRTATFSIPDSLYVEICAAWETTSGELFATQRLAITNRITRAVQKTIDVHVTPHSLRHTFATLAMESGQISLQEVSKWLNHASSDTTAKYYLHGKRSDAGKNFARQLAGL